MTDQAASILARLGFASGEPADVLLDRAVVTLGSAPDNDVQLHQSDVADHHLELQLTPALWLLRVCPGAERVHVNARPVRELAVLHCGDRIAVAGTAFTLLPADREPRAPVRPQADAGAATSCSGLRGIAGPLSGRFLVLHGGFQLDPDLLPDMDGCLRLFPVGNQANFELVGDDAPLPAVNGLVTRRGVLAVGDQLIWGRHRFVLEPGLVMPPKLAPAPPPAARVAEADQESPWHGMAWLLVVAVVLAAIIAGLLLLPG